MDIRICRAPNDLATMTPFERLPGDPPVLSKEQAEALQKAEAARRAVNATKLDPNRPPLPVGGDKTQGKSFFEIPEKAGGGAVGGYDRLWLNQSTQYMVVDGQIRTSIVIDPPDGHVPPANSASRQRGRGGRALPTSDTGESADVNAAPRGQFDNPEQWPLSERCLLGFGCVVAFVAGIFVDRLMCYGAPGGRRLRRPRRKPKSSEKLMFLLDFSTF